VEKVVSKPRAWLVGGAAGEIKKMIKMFVSGRETNVSEPGKG
jgi:hypothetical protein